jgi:hypothetical protein
LHYAIEYLEVAKILCDHLIKNPEIETYALGSACMFNARLAVELFLKAAILRKDMNARLHHILEELGEEYKAAYPGNDFYWDIPFTVQVIGYEGVEKEQIIKNHTKESPLDQALRYPTNKHKKP